MCAVSGVKLLFSSQLASYSSVGPKILNFSVTSTKCAWVGRAITRRCRELVIGCCFHVCTEYGVVHVGYYRADDRVGPAKAVSGRSLASGSPAIQVLYMFVANLATSTISNSYN